MSAPSRSPAPLLPAGATGVRAHIFCNGVVRPVPPDLATLKNTAQNADTFIWIDVTEPTPAVMQDLQAHFDLHPLAVEDALHAHQRAKVEPYTTFWFVVVHSASVNERQTLTSHETALFVGSRFIITCQYQPSFRDEEILARWEAVPESWRHNSSSLMYVFFDYLVDSFGPLADDIERQLREVRVWLASGRAVRPALLRRIFKLEELSQEAYTVSVTLRDLLPPFMHASEDAPVGGPAEAPYYRDVHDHATGVVERLGSERDVSRRSFDIYQSLATQQQGAVARQLTVVATIFLPLTFLTGFFGQNFDFLIKHIASEQAFLLWGVGSYVISVVAIVVLVRLVARDR